MFWREYLCADEKVVPCPDAALQSPSQASTSVEPACRRRTTREFRDTGSKVLRITDCTLEKFWLGPFQAFARDLMISCNIIFVESAS